MTKLLDKFTNKKCNTLLRYFWREEQKFESPIPPIDFMDLTHSNRAVGAGGLPCYNCDDRDDRRGQRDNSYRNDDRRRDNCQDDFHGSSMDTAVAATSMMARAESNDGMVWYDIGNDGRSFFGHAYFKVLTL